MNGPDDPPITVVPVPGTKRLELHVNKGSRLLEQAKALRPRAEEAAVSFVFKYGLALIADGTSSMPQRKLRSGKQTRPPAERKFK